MNFKRLGAIAAFCLFPCFSPAIATHLPAHTLTAEDLSTWLDGLVPYAIHRRNVAGAVIVVVKDGKVLFEKGYGLSDIDMQTPMDPKTTLIRSASISKLFTWTAVMQLVEAGKLDPDRDINAYLDFKIPNTWPKPITLRNLATHTSGFEETNKNTYAPDAASMLSLADEMKTWTPERIYPPGQVIAYSNYGAALAGYIVQRVSGEQFEDYVAHHILAPLEMANSTFVQPLPPALARNMSKGYDVASSPPRPFELEELRPAGGLTTTADDISHFMIAHLDNGAFGASRILKPGTAILMHGEVYRFDPKLPGMALGFWHQDRNGHVVIGHGGDTVVFHSGLYLMLDQNVGLFLGENSEGTSEDLRPALFQGFMDRYFPAPPLPQEATRASAEADGRTIAGVYENSRRSESNFMVAEDIFNEWTVSENGDGTVSASKLDDPDGQTESWREVAPFRWRAMHSDRMLDARVENGRVAALMTDAMDPIAILTPAPFWRSAAWITPLLLASLFILSLAAYLWPALAILRWRYRATLQRTGKSGLAFRLARVAAIVQLALIFGWTQFFDRADSQVEFMSAGHDWMLRALQALGALSVAGAVIAFYAFAVGLRDPRRPWWAKGSDLLVALACAAVVVIAADLKFLSWSVNY